MRLLHHKCCSSLDSPWDHHVVARGVDKLIQQHCTSSAGDPTFPRGRLLSGIRRTFPRGRLLSATLWGSDVPSRATLWGSFATRSTSVQGRSSIRPPRTMLGPRPPNRPAIALLRQYRIDEIIDPEYEDRAERFVCPICIKIPFLDQAVCTPNCCSKVFCGPCLEPCPLRGWGNVSNKITPGLYVGIIFNKDVVCRRGFRNRGVVSGTFFFSQNIMFPTREHYVPGEKQCSGNPETLHEHGTPVVHEQEQQEC